MTFRELVKSQGSNIYRLCKVSGLSPSVVGRVMRLGRCNTTTMVKLAAALNVDITKVHDAMMQTLHTSNQLPEIKK